MFHRRIFTLLVFLIALAWPTAGLFAENINEPGNSPNTVSSDSAENEVLPPLTGGEEFNGVDDDAAGDSGEAIASGNEKMKDLDAKAKSADGASPAQGNEAETSKGNTKQEQVWTTANTPQEDQVVSEDSTDLTIDADQMDYDVEAKAVVATGNVLVRSEADGLEIHADEMVYTNDGWIQVKGEAVLKYKAFSVQGVGLRYHFPSKAGELKRFKGDDGIFHISGDGMKFSPEYKLITGGGLTSCDRSSFCYRLKAGSIKIENNRIILKRGWLSVFGIPLLPLPYLSINPNAKETWPFFNIGANNDRGGFAVVEKSLPFATNWSIYGGLGLGTERWGSIGVGLEWKSPQNNLWNMEYNLMTDKERLDSTINYVLGPIDVKMSAFREWDEYDEFFGKMTEKLTLWKDQEESLALEFSQERRRIIDLGDKNGDNAQEKYGGNLYGGRLLYAPSEKLAVGYGWVYGDGDLREFGIEDWAQEVVLRAKQPLNAKWTLHLDGAYQWSDDDEHWNKKLIGLSRNLHCFTAEVDWDGVDEEWGFSLKLNF